jgi:hypothetical protein
MKSYILITCKHINICSYIVIIVIISISKSHANTCNNVASSVSPSFIKLIQYTSAGLSALAISPQFAKESDEILSKLLKVKSPLIPSWMKRNNLFKASEQEIANAWRSYYFKARMFSKFSKQPIEDQKSLEKLIEKINSKFFPKKYKDNIKNTFEQAKTLSLHYIKKLPLTKSDKRKISDRVSAIKLYWPVNIRGTKVEKNVQEFFDWGVAYDPLPNEINIGLEIIKYPNNQTLFAVFAHEIGHSIDSCRWSSLLKGRNPFKNVNNCLRKKESAYAKHRDDTYIHKLPVAYQKSLIDNPTCNRSVFPPRGMQKDQLPESFADWFSAEIIAESSLNKFNIRTDLCKDSGITSTSSYKTNKERLELIYHAQPKLKKALGLKNNVEYCPFK